MIKLYLCNVLPTRPPRGAWVNRWTFSSPPSPSPPSHLQLLDAKMTCPCGEGEGGIHPPPLPSSSYSSSFSFSTLLTFHVTWNIGLCHKCNIVIGGPLGPLLSGGNALNAIIHREPPPKKKYNC